MSSTHDPQLELAASEEALRSATKTHALQLALSAALDMQHTVVLAEPRSSEQRLSVADPSTVRSTSVGSVHVAEHRSLEEVTLSMSRQTQQLRQAARSVLNDAVAVPSASVSVPAAELSLNDSSFLMFAQEFHDIHADISALEAQSDDDADNDAV